MNENVKLEPIPDYGDHMTIEEFLNAVRSGFFINYDGYAELATATEMSNIRISPSRALDNPEVTKWTHVVWFNR